MCKCRAASKGQMFLQISKSSALNPARSSWQSLEQFCLEFILAECTDAMTHLGFCILHTNNNMWRILANKSFNLPAFVALQSLLISTRFGLAACLCTLFFYAICIEMPLLIHLHRCPQHSGSPQKKLLPGYQFSLQPSHPSFHCNKFHHLH